jgi:hypothetical protein
VPKAPKLTEQSSVVPENDIVDVIQDIEASGEAASEIQKKPLEQSSSDAT